MPIKILVQLQKESVMHIHVPLSLYKQKLKLYENEAVSLNTLFKPFDIRIDNEVSDDTLSIGLVLDELSERFYNFECVDPTDVANTAWELGFQAAGDFLDSGPAYLRQLLLEHEAKVKF